MQAVRSFSVIQDGDIVFTFAKGINSCCVLSHCKSTGWLECKVIDYDSTFGVVYLKDKSGFTWKTSISSMGNTAEFDYKQNKKCSF